MQFIKENFVNLLVVVTTTIVLGGFVIGITKGREMRFKHEKQRQVEIDTFYVAHRCVPEGYVATRYEPLRTYRCDNGLFIASDMK